MKSERETVNEIVHHEERELVEEIENTLINVGEIEYDIQHSIFEQEIELYRLLLTEEQEYLTVAKLQYLALTGHEFVETDF